MCACLYILNIYIASPYLKYIYIYLCERLAILNIYICVCVCVCAHARACARLPLGHDLYLTTSRIKYFLFLTLIS